MNIGQRGRYGTAPSPSRTTNILRVVVGLIWVAGAAWNLLVTRRMADPFGWLADGSRFAAWRWFFGKVADAHRSFWIALLVLVEAALGMLTLGRGMRARLGLAGGALFSLVLFSLGTSYTLMMGPYAILLAWLARHRFNPEPDVGHHGERRLSHGSRWHDASHD